MIYCLSKLHVRWFDSPLPSHLFEVWLGGMCANHLLLLCEIDNLIFTPTSRQDYPALCWRKKWGSLHFFSFVTPQFVTITVCISATLPVPPCGDCPEMCGIFHLLSITNFLFHLPVLPIGTTINTLAFNLSDSDPAHNPDWVSRRVWWLSRVAKPCPPPPTHQCFEPPAFVRLAFRLKISICLTHTKHLPSRQISHWSVYTHANNT